MFPGLQEIFSVWEETQIEYKRELKYAFDLVILTSQLKYNDRSKLSQIMKHKLTIITQEHVDKVTYQLNGT